MSLRPKLVIPVVLVLCALVAVLVGLFAGEPREAVGAPDPAPARPAAAPTAPVQLSAVRAPDARTVEAAIESDRVQTPPAEPAVDPEASTEVADLEAKLPMELVVVDESDQPVFDASIRVDGMRSAAAPGSWFQYRGEALTARTDAFGRAHLDCWTWADIDGRTTAIDIEVTHPEFVPYRESSFRVEPGEHRIVLARGAVVSVLAWFESANRRVDDVTIDLEREAMLGRSAWTRESDGRMVTTRINPGAHVLRVTHRPQSAEDRLLYSDFVEFDVRANERVDLAVELRGALDLRGQLDEWVPRPIVDGHVMLSLHRSTASPNASTLGEDFEADVASDGTFVFHELPPGSGHVFALARGCVSALIPPRTLAEAGITLAPGATPEDEARALEMFGRGASRPQTVVVPALDALIVRMIATGRVEILVQGDEGKPIADATVFVSPNVTIPEVGSIIAPWREWSAISDALGIARFEDVPPDPQMWLGINAEGWQLRAAERAETPWVEVKPSELARRTLALERVGRSAASPK